MGFPTYMDEVDNGAPAPFHQQFLKYRQLKDQLRKLADLPTLQREAEEQVFLQGLQVHVRDINRLFETTAQKIAASQTAVQRKQTGRLTRHLKLSLLGSLTAAGKEKREQADRHLADQAHWCREYAKVNAVALRKILEQHDKMLHNGAGQMLLKACWEDSIGGHHLLQGSKTDFLHSPLLDELKALESRVQAEFSVLTPSALVVDRLRELDEANGHAATVQAAHDDLTDNGVVEGRTGAVHHGIKQDIVRQWLDKAAPPDSHTLQEPDDKFMGEPEPAPESWSGDSLMARAAQCLKKNKADKLNDDEVDDYDWTCQGCLNILYCPFGLRCGHQLCKICALRCAGMSQMLGDPVRLLAKASPQAKCPECQQQGMFEDIMYLNQVDQLVKERFPVQWLGRQADDKQRTGILQEMKYRQEAQAHFSYGL